MGMKLWQLQLIIIGLSISIGVYFGYKAYDWLHPTREILVYQPETTIVEVIIPDTTIVYDIIIQKDTLIITRDTPLGDIPVRTLERMITTPLRVGKEIKPLSQRCEIDYRGLIYRIRITPIPDPFTIELKENPKLFNAYGHIAVSFDIHKSLLSEMEVGIEIKRLCLFGRLTASEYPIKVMPYVGLKYRFF